MSADAAPRIDHAEPAGDKRSREFWALLKRAAGRWWSDNAMRLSAAVAMYSILSLSPLLVITIKALSLILGEETAARQVELQAGDLIGPVGAGAVHGMIAATQPGAGVLATVVSAAILLFTASGVFAELRDSLNEVWHVEPKSGGGWWSAVRERLGSIGMVFVIGFLLLVSQILTTVLTAATQVVAGGAGWVTVGIDFVVSTVVITLLFAALFRFLPDVRLAWRDVLLGAAVTAVLFKIGQIVQALYFTYGTTASLYGAAGSFVVVLLWVYYSCWILFFGAELVGAYVNSHGRRIEPDATARKTTDTPKK
jgi:membrane protein